MLEVYGAGERESVCWRSMGLERESVCWSRESLYVGVERVCMLEVYGAGERVCVCWSREGLYVSMGL